MVAHEFQSQMSIDHENIVTVYDHFRQQIDGINHLVIVSEKCDKPLHAMKPYSLSSCITILPRVLNRTQFIAGW